MSQNAHHDPDLMGGISFLRNDLVGQPAKVTVAIKPTTALQVMQEAISTGDEALLVAACERMAKPASTIGENKIAHALVAAGWPGNVADILLQHELLNHSAGLKAMQHANDWRGVLWMCASPASIALAESKIGTPLTERDSKGAIIRSLHPYVERLISKHPELLEDVLDLDLARILRRTSGGRYGESHRGIDWINQQPIDPDNKFYLRLVDLVFDPELAKSVWEGEHPDTIQEEWAMSSRYFVNQLLYGGSPEVAAKIEAVLRKCPNAQRAWLAFWNTSTQNDIESAHPFAGDTRKAIETVGRQWEGDGGLLGLLVRESPQWVREAMLKEGPLSQSLYDKVAEGRRVHWFVAGLARCDYIPLLDSLVERLGTQWRDPDGRTLGHAVAMCAPVEQKTFMWLRDHPKAQELMMIPDQEGKTAMDFMASSDRWIAWQDRIVKAKRDMLLAQAKECHTPVKSTAAPKRSM